MLNSLTAHHIPQENKTRIFRELQGNKPDDVSGFASHMFEVQVKMESFQRKIPNFGQLSHFIWKESQIGIMTYIQRSQVFQEANLRRYLNKRTFNRHLNVKKKKMFSQECEYNKHLTKLGIFTAVAQFLFFCCFFF